MQINLLSILEWMALKKTKTRQQTNIVAGQKDPYAVSSVKNLLEKRDTIASYTDVFPKR